MKFNEAFEEYMSLYTENLWAKIGAAEQGEKVGRDGRGMGPDSKEDKDEKEKKEEETPEEDSEKKRLTDRVADKISNALDTGKDWKDGSVIKAKPLVGVARRAAKIANRVGAEVVKSGIDITKAAVKGATEGGPYKRESRKSLKRRLDQLEAGEDCETCGCSDEEVEDCETCGCQENPEYGHFNDKFSDYIDQYTKPVEDAERVDKDRMKCNKPRRTSGGSKKFVVKACENGKEKVVRFGDPNMKIKKSNPKRRKSFRARHKCDQKKSKFSAGYWSCKKW